MKFNNENETKELGFGAAESATPVSTSENTTAPTPKPEGKQATFVESTPAPKNAEASTPKPETNSGNGGGNSFYERQQNNSTTATKWYSDWRGKTLGVSLAALILIGAGIPAGMALGGYWHDGGEANLVDQTEIDTASDITADEIERIYDKAILAHYDNLVGEGFITQKAHDNKIDDAEETADDTIDNEKETLKANYGNTWEEEWDNSLKEKGFHTAANGGEQEYKDSMVSSTLEESIKSKYTTKSAITSVVLADHYKATDYDFSSTKANKNDKYYFVENQTPAFYASDKTWADLETEGYSYSYTPEDLMNLFVKTYEPIVLNNSLLPFTPVEGANDTEANIQGDNVYVSNENVKSAWSFANAEAAGTAPAATNYGGIQSKYKVDLSSQGLGTEANISVDLLLSGKTTAGSTTVKEIVDAGFANVTDLGKTDSLTVTSTDIENMNSNDVQQFGKGISEALKAAGLLTADDGTKRTLGVKGIFTPNDVATETVSFVSTNGLNNVGVSFENDAVIIEQLDNYAGLNGAIDLSLVSTFNTWFSATFKYITLIDYLSNPTNVEDGWFDATGNLALTVDADAMAEIGSVIDEADIEAIAGEGATQEDAQLVIQTLFPFILLKDEVLSTKNTITETYNSAKSFVDTNWQDYESEDFETGLGNDIVTFMSGSNKNTMANKYLEKLLEIMSAKENETKDIILNKGGDE